MLVYLVYVYITFNLKNIVFKVRNKFYDWMNKPGRCKFKKANTTKLSNTANLDITIHTYALFTTYKFLDKVAIKLNY